MLVNKKSQYILENNIQTVINRKNVINDAMLIELNNNQLIDILLKNTNLIHDLTKIILEYVDDVLIINYNICQIITTMYIDIKINSQTLFFDVYNFDFTIMCLCTENRENKVSICNVLSECIFSNILSNSTNTCINLISFFNYFMYHFYNKNKYLDYKLGFSDNNWIHCKDLEYKYIGKYGVEKKLNVLCSNKLTNVIEIYKIIIGTINEILLKN